MGISKLTTFMNYNPRLHKEFQLHSTKVVVDGNSLYHSIFYKNEVDVIHGGDYYDYALKIKEFFSLLQSCNIQPFVVFDGGNEPDDKKFETTRRRMKYRQKLLKRLARNKENEDGVVPILAFDTFRAVLDELSIELTVCEFEADKEIGLLANKLSCPVISNDSDFFMLPLTAGFILFDWVTLTLHTIETENGSNYLPAKIYHIDNFVIEFPSLGVNVLHVLPTLVGNDYIDTRIFKLFYDHIRGLPLAKSQFSMPDSENKIYNVIHWLEKSGKTFEEVKETCKNFGNEQSISSAFEITEKAFTFSKTENEKKMHSLFEGEESTTVGKTARSNKIPEWYVVNHGKGFLPPRLMDIITIHKRFLAPQMEDRESPATSYQCSIKIRAFMYGILLPEDILKGGWQDVEEYDYRDSFSTGRFVNPQRILENYGTPPKLSEIENLSRPDREAMLGKILNIHSLSKFNLTKDLELVMGIVLFWIKESDPKVTLYHLKSVIICMIMLKVKLEVLFHHDATGCETNLIETAVLEMTREDLEEANANFLTYYTKLEHSGDNRVDCKLIHGFAQFQTCIMATMHLNFLLLRPFPSPCIPHIFSGTFMYRFCLKLSVQKNPDVFIHKLLLKDSKLDKAYQCLFDAVMEAIGPQGSATYFKEIWGREKRSQKRSRVETPPMPTGNPYSCLYSSDSESDD